MKTKRTRQEIKEIYTTQYNKTIKNLLKKGLLDKNDMYNPYEFFRLDNGKLPKDLEDRIYIRVQALKNTYKKKGVNPPSEEKLAQEIARQIAYNEGEGLSYKQAKTIKNKLTDYYKENNMNDKSATIDEIRIKGATQLADINNMLKQDAASGKVTLMEDNKTHQKYDTSTGKGRALYISQQIFGSP